LEPQSNEEFVAQLAQFSALEEAQNINATLQANAILTQSVNNALSAGLIGREITTAGNSLVLGSEGEVTVPFQLSEAADVTVTIKDEGGNVVMVVRATGLESGDGHLIWDGTNERGARVAAGSYTYTVEAVGAQGSPVRADTFFKGVVSGVKFVGGAAVLLVGDREIPLGAVLEIGLPQSEKE
jgi:flagellar basal-body rod modification protein FlgD